MHSNNSNKSRAARTRDFMALGAMLAMGLGAMAPAAQAAPFAYVANTTGNSVSVIDTATNKIVGSPIPVGTNPEWDAVTPDGKHVYVTNINSASVSVIATATNTVIATIPVGSFPIGVAITPDGTHAYVANNGSKSISVIYTATNKVVGTSIPVGTFPVGSPSLRMGNKFTP
jgi:YVTN family beta-propeller protein